MANPVQVTLTPPSSFTGGQVYGAYGELLTPSGSNYIATNSDTVAALLKHGWVVASAD